MHSSFSSSRALQKKSPDGDPEKTSSDPYLDELRQLSRDLKAFRLQLENQFNGSKTSQDWQEIGKVIDRLLFGLYIVFISVSFITIMSIWIWTSSHIV